MPAPTRALVRLGTLLSISLGLIAITPSAFGHGDDQVLIDALTDELAKAPDADLFIRRGELYRHHQEWAKASADFESAAKLEPKLTIVDFFRARLLLESGEPLEAQTFVERYVKNTPDEAEGWFLRGDVRAALGDHEAGALDYVEGLRKTPRPRPEHYLRRAKFLALAPKPDPARILAALDEGIQRVGPVISLVDYAISLELERKNYSAALDRIDETMKHAPRRETWLVRKGDILVQAGRASEAAAAYRAALAAIDDLPPRYRDTAPMEKLARDAQVALGRITPDNHK